MLTKTGVFLSLNKRVNNKVVQCPAMHCRCEEGTLCTIRHGCEQVYTIRKEALHALHHGSRVTHMCQEAESFSCVPHMVDVVTPMVFQNSYL